MGTRRITKSATDQVIDGVLGGLADYLGIETVVVRLLYMVLAIANPAIGVLAYIAMAVIMPGPDGRLTRNLRGVKDAVSDGPATDQDATEEATQEAVSEAGVASVDNDADWDEDDDVADAADEDDYEDARPDRVHIIGAGLVALGVFLIFERFVTLPDFSSFAWAIAILGIGVWILVRGKRSR